MLLHASRKLPRHRAQVRSAEAGALHCCRLGVFSLQFRWDYFQDILYMPCTYRYMRCVYNICTMPFKYTMPGANAFREFPDPKVGNHSQLCVFFQETIFRSINKKGPLCCFVLFTPTKTNMSFEKKGCLEDYWPLFRGRVSFRGVQYALYTHGPAHIGWFSHS